MELYFFTNHTYKELIEAGIHEILARVIVGRKLTLVRPSMEKLAWLLLELYEHGVEVGVYITLDTGNCLIGDYSPETGELELYYPDGKEKVIDFKEL